MRPSIALPRGLPGFATGQVRKPWPLPPKPSGSFSFSLPPVTVTLGYQEWAEGSVLLEMGRTRVLVAATYEEKVPRWLSGRGSGWVTAEYSMLPRATLERTPREVSRGRPSGRTQEIQRLIGRSLRAVTNLRKLGEVMITVDCDVLQADGGTRTASITAGYVALALAVPVPWNNLDWLSSPRWTCLTVPSGARAMSCPPPVSYFEAEVLQETDFAEESATPSRVQRCEFPSVCISTIVPLSSMSIRASLVVPVS